MHTHLVRNLRRAGLATAIAAPLLLAPACTKPAPPPKPDFVKDVNYQVVPVGVQIVVEPGTTHKVVTDTKQCDGKPATCVPTKLNSYTWDRDTYRLLWQDGVKQGTVQTAINTARHHDDMGHCVSLSVWRSGSNVYATAAMCGSGD